MTDADDWEHVARETTCWTLHALLDEAEATIDLVTSPLFWGQPVTAEEVTQMRALAFEFEYVTEAYLARLSDETTPWSAGYDPSADRPRPLPDVTAASDTEDTTDGT